MEQLKDICFCHKWKAQTRQMLWHDHTKVTGFHTISCENYHNYLPWQMTVIYRKMKNTVNLFLCLLNHMSGLILLHLLAHLLQAVLHGSKLITEGLQLLQVCLGCLLGQQQFHCLVFDSHVLNCLVQLPNAKGESERTMAKIDQLLPQQHHYSTDTR